MAYISWNCALCWFACRMKESLSSRSACVAVCRTSKYFQLLCLSSVSCGEGNGTPLQDSCLANPMNGGAWWAAGHGVTRSRTRLSNVTFTFHFHALGEEMATHSSVVAWRIPGTGKPCELLSMGSQSQTRLKRLSSSSSSSSNR